MRTIERSVTFKRDYKREAKGRHRNNLDKVLISVITSLVIDEPLKTSHRDHDLIGKWSGHRECHIKPDLLLIYRKPDSETLQLVRLGSHAQLFG
ncbi:type II toxin-antitoxin system YafQ family toxin (plasmid) [Arsenophonus nasoniae]|uniref:Type II toxin-antitoxin system YafQ family toxin n=1 Tax=Arsenophonus nasoniae TaxID=638 RepID=A0A4P7KZH7_9GAMM|nr:type II toxin-antitoxin system YafQ family toxin [Arsenophonus nasoniae]QBY45829.1 mRNA interferase YafQ [Arsenophonus nasoniae]WGM03773.1 type II toxin-antitoxin system YafQ family toxin [Arsenophonus nasoniae]WGM03825.1 type II toxin-antitoxin system YafQ family toxin [Arsenophonus nasoniae]WGM03885.1 type II toxin-antitoxin system YafQ family toxin [Arsenophonus nasoniae]WGM08073.1 type II toxin-antitoxin system YafQ family toxin [Arsenophonus nasoniae]